MVQSSSPTNLITIFLLIILEYDDNLKLAVNKGLTKLQEFKIRIKNSVFTCDPNHAVNSRAYY